MNVRVCLQGQGTSANLGDEAWFMDVTKSRKRNKAPPDMLLEENNQ